MRSFPLLLAILVFSVTFTSTSLILEKTIPKPETKVSSPLVSPNESNGPFQILNPMFTGITEPEIKCIKGIIGTDLFEKIALNQRAPNEPEYNATDYCRSQRRQFFSQNSSPSPPRPTPVPSNSLPSNLSKTRSSSSPSLSPNYDIHAEVWTKNGYDGASYEYKVNCGPNYDKLETCFLWDVARVVVTNPSGTSYELNKDFNINGYSGEVTRRWVLYGPSSGGLPLAGKYMFTYYKGETVALSQEVSYTPEVVEPPTNITFTRDGKDIMISWQAPAGINITMWYKPSIDPPGNDRQIITKVVAWDATSAKLGDVPVSPGEEVEVNVAIFFRGGYAYPKPITITW